VLIWFAREKVYPFSLRHRKNYSEYSIAPGKAAAGSGSVCIALAFGAVRIARCRKAFPCITLHQDNGNQKSGTETD
jgi:hypothetical protein